MTYPTNLLSSATKPATDQPESLFLVLDAVRAGARTRPEIADRTGLGRKAVAQRIEQLIHSGLVEQGDLAPSTGGRAPRGLHFRSGGGSILVAQIAEPVMSVGICDLTGQILDRHDEEVDVYEGPDAVLIRIESMFEMLLARRESLPPLWGIGIGVLGPVDARTGRPMELPVMPGWGNYPIRDRLTGRFGLPTWVDNGNDLMALGEHRSGVGTDVNDLVFVEISHGIGAGIITNGELARGFLGAAGELGHLKVVDDESVTCWCGNAGCLTQLASAEALARAGERIAREGGSEVLTRIWQESGRIGGRDVAAAAASGDRACLEEVSAAGRHVGRALAMVATFTNPELILVGGEVAVGGDVLLAAIREVVYREALPMSTRGLRVEFSELASSAGLIGAAFMVVDQLLSRQLLGLWIDDGAPSSLLSTGKAGHGTPLGSSAVPAMSGGASVV